MGSYRTRGFGRGHLAGVAVATALLLVPAGGGAAVATAGAAAGTGALARRVSMVRRTAPVAGATAPTDAFCRQSSGTPCYSPQEIRHAYGVNELLSHGTGRGQTIVIVDSFGSPTIAADLHTFDAGYGLSDPPSLKVLAPLGTVPFDPNNGDMVNWALETTLDVEWSHAMAPDAAIVVLTSPVSETQGVQGMPQFLSLENYALNHHLGQIISQSWGTTENTLFTAAGRQVYDGFEEFYQRAARAGITVLASSGDAGTANPDVHGHLYPFPTVNFPASSPWVTAVGGTSLMADTHGHYQSETVWNSGGATGGGISQKFAEPSWQQSLPASDQRLLDGHRGLPDVAFNADPSTSILVYLSFVTPGYYAVGGTSEGAPQWAGIVADADQAVGHPLGFLNPLIYRLGARGVLSTVLHDITVGNNSGIGGIPGYNAMHGWDPTTGWGTPKELNALLGG